MHQRQPHYSSLPPSPWQPPHGGGGGNDCRGSVTSISAFPASSPFSPISATSCIYRSPRCNTTTSMSTTGVQELPASSSSPCILNQQQQTRPAPSEPLLLPSLVCSGSATRSLTEENVLLRSASPHVVSAESCLRAIWLAWLAVLLFDGAESVVLHCDFFQSFQRRREGQAGGWIGAFHHPLMFLGQFLVTYSKNLLSIGCWLCGLLCVVNITRLWLLWLFCVIRISLLLHSTTTDDWVVLELCFATSVLCVLSHHIFRYRCLSLYSYAPFWTSPTSFSSSSVPPSSNWGAVLPSVDPCASPTQAAWLCGRVVCRLSSLLSLPFRWAHSFLFQRQLAGRRGEVGLITNTLVGKRERGGKVCTEVSSEEAHRSDVVVASTSAGALYVTTATMVRTQKVLTFCGDEVDRSGGRRWWHFWRWGEVRGTEPEVTENSYADSEQGGGKIGARKGGGGKWWWSLGGGKKKSVSESSLDASSPTNQDSEQELGLRLRTMCGSRASGGGIGFGNDTPGNRDVEGKEVVCSEVWHTRYLPAVPPVALVRTLSVCTALQLSAYYALLCVHKLNADFLFSNASCAKHVFVLYVSQYFPFLSSAPSSYVHAAVSVIPYISVCADFCMAMLFLFPSMRIYASAVCLLFNMLVGIALQPPLVLHTYSLILCAMATAASPTALAHALVSFFPRFMPAVLVFFGYGAFLSAHFFIVSSSVPAAAAMANVSYLVCAGGVVVICLLSMISTLSSCFLTLISILPRFSPFGVLAQQRDVCDKKKEGGGRETNACTEADSWSRASSHATTARGHSRQSHRSRSTGANEKRSRRRSFSPFSSYSSFCSSPSSSPASRRCGGLLLSRLEDCLPCSVSMDGVSSRLSAATYVLSDTQVMKMGGNRIEHAYDWQYHRLLLLSNRSSLSRFSHRQTQPPAGVEWAAAARAVVDPMASFSLVAEEEQQDETGITRKARGQGSREGSTSVEKEGQVYRHKQPRDSHSSNPSEAPCPDSASIVGPAGALEGIGRHSISGNTGHFRSAASASPSSITRACMGGSSVTRCTGYGSGGPAGVGVGPIVGGSGRASFHIGSSGIGTGDNRFSEFRNPPKTVANGSGGGAITHSSTIAFSSTCSTELPSMASSLCLHGLSPTSSFGVSPPHSPPLAPPQTCHQPPNPHGAGAGLARRRHGAGGVDRFGTGKEQISDHDNKGDPREKGKGGVEKSSMSWLRGCRFCNKRRNNRVEVAQGKREQGGATGGPMASEAESFGIGARGGESRRQQQEIVQSGRMKGEDNCNMRGEADEATVVGECPPYCVVGRLSRRIGFSGELIYDCLVVSYQLVVPFSFVFLLGALFVLVIGLLPHAGVGDVGTFTDLTNMQMSRGGEAGDAGVGNHLLTKDMSRALRDKGEESDADGLVRVVYTELRTLQQYQVDVSSYYSPQTLKFFVETGIDPSLIETNSGYDSQHLYSQRASLLSPTSSTPTFRPFSLSYEEFRHAVALALPSTGGDVSTTIIEVHTTAEGHKPEYKSILYKLVDGGKTLQLFHNGEEDGEGRVVWNMIPDDHPLHHLHNILAPDLQDKQEDKTFSSLNWRLWMKSAQRRLSRKNAVAEVQPVCRV
eukprot:GHVS01071381.1.p1 GENE.GHVS01071381.1~~GHVS01071381.1.p1  ORF type:complete len:1594 (-),score=247.86 GHVS01071381.1:366-5147(-)